MSVTFEKKKQNKPQVGRNWCFVINNPITNDFLALSTILFKGLIWQEEVGDEGTRHIQGYVELHKSTTRACITRRLGNRANCSLRRRSQRVASEYCEKETFDGARRFKEITISFQGKRSDLSTIRSELRSGAPMRSIADEHFGDFIRYHRGFYLYQRLVSEPRESPTRFHVIWGGSGFGKSRKAAKDYPAAYWCPRPNCGTIWFDGITEFQTIVFDNYYGWCPYDLLLRVVDTYPILLPTRQGFVNWRGPELVVTSVKPWNQWYDWSKCDISELERRILLGKITHFIGLNKIES